MADLFGTDELDSLLIAIGTEADELVRYIATLAQEKHVRRIRAMTEYKCLLFDDGQFQQPATLIGQVFVAVWGSTMKLNDFAIVVEETDAFATLYPLKSYQISGSLNSGHELPLIPRQFRHLAKSPESMRLKKTIKDGVTTFRGESKYFELWPGKPMAHHGD